MPHSPPDEEPTQWISGIPRWSMRSSTSVASRSADHSARSGGAEDSPHPRMSYLSTLYFRESPGTHWVHHFMLRDRPWDIRMVSPWSDIHGSLKSSS